LKNIETTPYTGGNRTIANNYLVNTDNKVTLTTITNNNRSGRISITILPSILIETYKVRLTYKDNSDTAISVTSDAIVSNPFIPDSSIIFTKTKVGYGQVYNINWSSPYSITTPPRFTILRTYYDNINFIAYTGRDLTYTPTISPPAPPAPPILSSGSGTIRFSGFTTSKYSLTITITTPDNIEHSKTIIGLEYPKPKGGSRRTIKRGKRRSIKR
jgi:hypothetical protein